jgi:K+-sensing histidine kinase KdpD
MDAILGSAVCGLTALGLSAVASGHTWKNAVPLVFIAILLIIAAMFGVRAGVIGTVLAALVFATFLFSPGGKVPVASDAARANIGWMLLIGIAFSFLFAPSTGGFRRH